MKYEVWMEGYAATGDCGTATRLGSFEAASFKQACEKAIQVNKMQKHYDPSRNTYWGCRMFDNERAARKSFG